MRPFLYVRPPGLEETFKVMEEYGDDARLLAGGTDVMVRLRAGHMRPRVVVDLKRVAELRRSIDDVDGCLRIGARTVMKDLIGDPRVCQAFPALVESARVVGSVQIRNRATLVGNICNASPAADTAPSLLVYDAVANIVSGSGRRRLAIESFFTGPGRHALRRGELMESIDIPLPAKPSGSAFGRVTRRRGVDLATLNLTCLVSATGVTRFGFGAVAPTPILVEDETGTLARAARDSSSRTSILVDMIARAKPITDVRGGRDYRLAMLDVMSRRTLDTSLVRLRDAASGE